MIEVNHVSKRYGKHVALDDLNLTIEDGKIYGLLGENGAGKSTTMNIITGYLAPSYGEVLVDGMDTIKKAKKAKAKIGYLPEIPPLYQDMTVREYLKFAAQLKRIPRKERKTAINEALSKAGIDDVKKRLIKNLSKGYKQRVGIAQAILGNPEIVILDEPTVGLDPVQIKEIRDLIREIGKEHTVILSSHILSEISEVCDHVFMISGGKLVLDEDMSKIASLEEVFIEHSSSGVVDEDAPVFEEANEEVTEDSTEELPTVDNTFKKPSFLENVDSLENESADTKEEKDDKKLSRAEKKEEKRNAKAEKKQAKIDAKIEKKEAKEQAKRQARIEKRREARRKKNANKEEK